MKRFGLAILILAGLGGCAFGSRHVTLAYPPEPASGGRPPAVRTAPSPAEGAQVILTVFLDQRSTKQSIGSVHNGFGMHTADVLANNDVADWVTNGIKAELERAGFSVMRATGPAGSEPVVSGEVTRVYCEAWTKYEAEVTFDVTVIRAGKEILRKSYTGKNDSTTNWSASSKSYGQALAIALSNAAGNFAAEMRRDLASSQ